MDESLKYWFGNLFHSFKPIILLSKIRHFQVSIFRFLFFSSLNFFFCRNLTNFYFYLFLENVILYFFSWSYYFQIITYESPRGGVSVITKKEETTTSFLLIKNARPSDSGQYTCNPSNAKSQSVVVHVLNGKFFKLNSILNIYA